MGSTEGFDELDAKLEKLANMADIIETDIAPKVTQVMRNYAIKMVRNVWEAIDTGAMLGSIMGSKEVITRADGTTVEMGITSTSDHLRFVEFGTGIYGSNTYEDASGETHVSEGVTFSDKEKWYQHNPEYQGEFGKNNDPRTVEAFGETLKLYPEWIPRYAQHPRSIMRATLYDNTPLWRDMLEGKITGDIFE